MTKDVLASPPVYPISGIGPYAITHPYNRAEDIKPFVLVDGQLTALSTSEYSIDPVQTDTSGNLLLTSDAAVVHDGESMHIIRVTQTEQGWEAKDSLQEVGLEHQLDVMAMAMQDAIKMMVQALVVIGSDGSPVPVSLLADRLLLAGSDGQSVVPGPTANEIANAQQYAEQAMASAIAALAAENSLLVYRNAWVTATLYSPSSIVSINGSSYICVVEHTSGTFSADLAAGHWGVLAEKGAPGAGTGDMLAANNLSDLDNKPTAFDTIKQNASSGTSGVVLLSLYSHLASGDAGRIPDCAQILQLVKAYAPKVRANISGGLSPSINQGFNTDTVVRNGAGDYTLNFTTATASANYQVSHSIGFGLSPNNNDNDCVFLIAEQTVNYVRFKIIDSTDDYGRDPDLINITIFEG